MRKHTLTLATAAAAILALGGAGAAYADGHMDKRRGPDANGDGVVTLAEMTAGSDAMFTRMDANGDGVLNEEDRAAHKAARFAKMDANGDGEVTQAEMEALGAKRRAKRQAEHFARLDTDGNGGLSREELEAGHKKFAEHHGKRDGKRDGKRGKGGKMHGHGRGGRMAMAMLHQADTDGDKSVTRAEFDAAVTDHFTQADTNGDGQLSADERRAAHKAMRKKMRAFKEERRAARAAS